MSKIRKSRNNGGFDSLIKQILDAESSEDTDSFGSLEDDMLIEASGDSESYNSEDLSLSDISDEADFPLSDILSNPECSFQIRGGKIITEEPRDKELVENGSISKVSKQNTSLVNQITSLNLNSRKEAAEQQEDTKLIRVKNKTRNRRRCPNYDE